MIAEMIENRARTFVFAFIMIALLIIAIVVSKQEANLRECAEVNNVFACEYIAVPITPEKP